MLQLRQYLEGCNIYAKLIILTGMLLMVPLFALPFYPKEAKYLPSFLIPILLSFLLGAVINLFTNRTEDDVEEWQSPLQKGSFPVLVAWFYSFFAGALPFIISGILSPLHGVFESVNGWTTTGFTVLDVSELPHVFLLHRSFMQYCGGLGFILMMVMLTQGKQFMSLYNAEGHPDKLKPNLKQTARTIFQLYSGFSIVGIILYLIFGMNLFESICHTMSALATAGFSTRAGGIMEFDSLPINIITIILAMLGSTNFTILHLIVKGKVRQVLRISELRFLFIIFLIFIPLATISLINDMGMGLGEGFHKAFFGLVTTYSTTGYSTMNYAAWPPIALGLLMILMLVGGGIGSTAGGIKLLRAYLLLRFVKQNIKKRLSPTHNITSPHYYRAQGKTAIDKEVIEDMIGFITCFFTILVIGTLLLTITAKCSLFDAFFEFMSSLCTVGISNGITNPSASVGTLVVEMTGMILGRLEIFILFIGTYSGFRKLKKGIQRRLIKRQIA